MFSPGGSAADGTSPHLEREHAALQGLFDPRSPPARPRRTSPAEATVTSPCRRRRSLLCTSCSVAGGSFDHCLRRSARSAALAPGLRLPVAGAVRSSIDLGSSTSRRRKATFCSPFWDRSRSRLERAGLVAGEWPAHTGPGTDMLMGTCRGPGSLAGTRAPWRERGTAASDAADSRRTATKRFPSRDPDSFRRALCQRGRATRLGRPPGRRARGVRSGLLRAPRRGGAAAAQRRSGVAIGCAGGMATTRCP